VGQGSNGLSRGDVNRNARLAALRAVLPAGHAVLGIDLAQSRQAAVLTDHDSRVLARWRPRCSPWQLGDLLQQALQTARAAGFAGITVACEPTGHRWMIVQQLAAGRDIPLVCVQPLVVARAREAEDYTRGKNDDRDAVLIARQATQLHCYLPERADTRWARLRHLGARRTRLITDSTTCKLQLRDLLEVAWPAVLDTAGQPLKSATWLACLHAALDGGDGDLDTVHARGHQAFCDAVRAALPAWGATRVYGRITDAVYATLPDRAGVLTQRPGALERALAVLRGWTCSTNSTSGHWPDRSAACRRSPSRRSWPKPGTRPDSPPPGRWSNTPGSPRSTTPAATTTAPPKSPAGAGPTSGWPPGERSGARSATTTSTPPATPTSPPAPPANSPPSRPAPRSPPH